MAARTDQFQSPDYFKVDDLPRTHAAVLGRGAKNERAPAMAAKMPDHDLWMCFFNDPDGHTFALMEEKRR